MYSLLHRLVPLTYHRISSSPKLRYIIPRRSLTDQVIKSFPEIEQNETSLLVRWSPSLSSNFHYVWLRDNCRCPQCYHTTTKQKLLSSADIPLQIKPLDVKLKADAVEILWSHSLATDTAQISHLSSYPISWLKEFDYSSEVLRKRMKFDHPTQLWDSSLIKDVSLWKDYIDFIDPADNDKHLFQFVNNLQRYGIGFLTNVPVDDISQVEKVAQRFGPIRETFYGRSWDVKSVPNAKNIAYTSLFLDLHMDLMYFESPPGLQLLHCLDCSVNGGESIFMDSHKAFDIMSKDYPEDFQVLTQVPVTFEYYNNGHHLKFSRPTVTVNDLNHFMEVYYAPPFQGPLAAPDGLVEKFYKAFQVLGTLMKDNMLVYEIKLNPGDCVVFANRRVLHGRRSFDVQSGKRHLRGTYVDWDVLMDRYRVLKKLHKE